MGRAIMRVIGTIEARMGSTRLPGKTMMPIFKDAPLLECVVHRFKLCKNIDDVVVATTTSPKDDPIADWCRRNQIPFFRGSEENVLDRVVSAAKTNRADVIVQMGADSAYLDFQLIDELVDIFKHGDFDYVCNDLKLTYPLGIYGHVVRVSTLVTINRQSDLSEEERCDVVRRIFENPRKFRIKNIEATPEFRFPQLRFTIDYPEDIEQAREIYSHFDSDRFTTRDLLALFHQSPKIFERTKNLVQRSASHLPAKK